MGNFTNFGSGVMAVDERWFNVPGIGKGADSGKGCLT